MLTRQLAHLSTALAAAIALAAVVACGSGPAGQACDAEHPCPPDEACDLETGTCTPLEPGGCTSSSTCTLTAPYCTGVTEPSSAGTCAATCDGDDVCAEVDAASPFCNEGTCGACNVDTGAGCESSSTTPICEATNNDAATCRGCLDDDECPSDVCGDDGACVPATAIIYAAPDGPAERGAACDQAVPCALPTAALELGMGNRSIIKVVGNAETVFSLPSTLVIDAPALLLGSGATVELEAGAFGAVMSATSSLEVRDLTLQGGGGGVFGPGIKGQTGSDVVLRGVTLRANEGAGAQADGALHLVDSLVTDNGFGGCSGLLEVHIDGSTLTGNRGRDSVVAYGPLTLRDSVVADGADSGVVMDADAGNVIERSEIRGHEQKGVSASGGVDIFESLIIGNGNVGIDAGPGLISLRNNVIARNGSLGSSVGGADVSATAGSLVAFNTIVLNQASPSGFGAMRCLQGGANAVEQGNLVYGNLRGGQTDNQVDSACLWDASLVLADATGLAFADLANDDFHLTTDSIVAIDLATSLANVDIDLDGDPRPTGAAPDFGADEYVP